MRQAGQRVRLVHELAELRGAEELLERGHDRADVDDRLRRDRVLVLGRQALADDALHPVEADAEGVLDQLADGAQAAVAEVLVLVEAVGDRVAGGVLAVTRERRGLGGVVLDLDLAVLGDAEPLRAGSTSSWTSAWMSSCVSVRVSRSTSRPEARVELVAADAREVVALGVEEQLLQQRVGGVDAGRLARALLLEELDQRALLRLRGLGVRLDRVADVERAAEQVEQLLVEPLDRPRGSPRRRRPSPGCRSCARSRTVTGSLRLRSIRTKTLPFLSISSSSHEPRAGIRFAVNICFSRSLGSIT